MFGTILWDVYEQGQAKDVHEAIEDLASAKDQFGWSSTAVYAFYDPDSRPANTTSHPLLYLGLATDLATRFAQHNGIIRLKPGSSKETKINEWFDKHPRLGFSAFMQSPMNQAHVSKFKNQFPPAVDWTEQFEYDTDARAAIAIVEGLAIESSVLQRGFLPLWNKIGGSKAGQVRAKAGSGATLLELMEGTADNLFVTRRSVRQMSHNPTEHGYEADFLHAARMSVLAFGPEAGVSSAEILSHLDLMSTPGSPWFSSLDAERIAFMRQSGYLNSSTR